MGIDIQQYRASIGSIYLSLKITGKNSSKLQILPTKNQCLFILALPLLIACVIFFTIGTFYLPINKMKEGRIHTLVSSENSLDLLSGPPEHDFSKSFTLPLLFGTVTFRVVSQFLVQSRICRIYTPDICIRSSTNLAPQVLFRMVDNFQNKYTYGNEKTKGIKIAYCLIRG